MHAVMEQAASANPAAANEPRNQVEYIQQSREAHHYSPGIQKLYDLALSYFPDAEKGNQEGKPAVWSTGLMEAPLLYACDTIPMAVYDLGRLGSAVEAAELSEDIFDMPKETCSMVSALIGEWYLRRNNSVKKVVALAANPAVARRHWREIADRGPPAMIEYAAARNELARLGA